MQPMSLFVVMNAGSGHGDTQIAIEIVREKLAQSGRQYELFLVQNPQQLPLLAGRAASKARTFNGAVIGAGGDGTLNAVARAAYAFERPFGALPLGTFNYFGRNHHIPEDPATAMDAVLRGVPHATQVGQINGQLILVNASLGLYPKLLEDREAYKQQFGRNRFVALAASVITFLRDHRALQLQIERDGVVKTLQTSTLFVGNNALQLEQIGIDEADAVPGQLAAIAVLPAGKSAMMTLLLRGALGSLGASENIESFPFTRLIVTPRLSYGPRRIKVAIDGEIHWFRVPLTFEVAPRPLQLLMPPELASVSKGLSQ
ncbi:MAG TPA: diacylglycerol kinase family protein [Dongiaceae bacterium]|nr:diacylglycerol kinase family protein [Dongiaceae bacterium]